MTLDDLAAYSSEWVQPISIAYRGWKVYELPPNGQSVAALEMLNIMQTRRPLCCGIRQGKQDGRSSRKRTSEQNTRKIRGDERHHKT